MKAKAKCAFRYRGADYKRADAVILPDKQLRALFRAELIEYEDEPEPPKQKSAVQEPVIPTKIETPETSEPPEPLEPEIPASAPRGSRSANN